MAASPRELTLGYAALATDADSTVLHHLLAHRSVRAYRGDPVDEDVLRDCLATGLRAPSSDLRRA